MWVGCGRRGGGGGRGGAGRGRGSGDPPFLDFFRAPRDFAFVFAPGRLLVAASSSLLGMPMSFFQLEEGVSGPPSLEFESDDPPAPSGESVFDADFTAFRLDRVSRPLWGPSDSKDMARSCRPSPKCIRTVATPPSPSFCDRGARRAHVSLMLFVFGPAWRGSTSTCSVLSQISRAGGADESQNGPRPAPINALACDVMINILALVAIDPPCLISCSCLRALVGGGGGAVPVAQGTALLAAL